MVVKTIFKTAYEKAPMLKQQSRLDSNDSQDLCHIGAEYFVTVTNCPDWCDICLGEKEISPKVLKITPRVLMITFGVIDQSSSPIYDGYSKMIHSYSKLKWSPIQ